MAVGLHIGGVGQQFGVQACAGKRAAQFVATTGVDVQAIAIGTSHGAYKFTRKPTGDILAIDRIAAIHAQIPGTHLVTHGSSSVSQEWLAIIHQFGGDIKETYGMPAEFDPRKALIAAHSAARGICRDRFETFACAGQASKIRPAHLDAMALRYAS
jgi:fructose-bisphosphate aldolase, class II